MKKIFGIIISLLLIAGSGVGVYYVVKESSVSLQISVENVELFTEQSQAVKYSCNIKDAEVTFSVVDTSIAKVEKKDADFIVTGLSAGTTKLNMVAKYNKYKNFSEATIVVKAQEDEGETDVEIEYELHGVNNFAVSENYILMTAEEPSLFSVVSSSGNINSVSVTCSDEKVIVTPKTTNKSFKIECSYAGEYELVVTVNGFEKIFNLHVDSSADSSEEEDEGTSGAEDDPQIDYTLLTQNCVLNGRTITMTSGINALIQIQQGSTEITSYDIVSVEGAVAVTKKPLQNMAYTLRCNAAGTFELSVIVNEISTIYTVIVQ